MSYESDLIDDGADPTRHDPKMPVLFFDEFISERREPCVCIARNRGEKGEEELVHASYARDGLRVIWEAREKSTAATGPHDPVKCS